MHKTLITILLIAGLASSNLALADRGGPGKFMRFFDTNEDGSVTREEFEAASKARFARMDANSDAQVTTDEFQAYIETRRGEKKAAKLKQVDTNNDGQVSKDEFVAYKSARAEQKFARMDTNQDDVLSAEEFKNCRKHDKGGKQGKRSGQRLFASLDANDDGQVTQEESLAAWSRWFARIDSNGDNVVTSEEVSAYRDMKHKK